MQSNAQTILITAVASFSAGGIIGVFPGVGILLFPAFVAGLLSLGAYFATSLGCKGLQIMAPNLYRPKILFPLLLIFFGSVTVLLSTNVLYVSVSFLVYLPLIALRLFKN